MKTIHRPAPNGNPRSVNDRCSHQCARPGWRPRNVPVTQLAEHIVASIQQRIAEGRAWSIAEYTDNPEMVAAVLELLPTKSPAQIDRLKREWLNEPCFFLEDTEGFEMHRHELIEFRLTHTSWAVAQAESSQALMAWDLRVTEEDAAQIEASRLIAEYLGWRGVPIDHNPRQVAALAQALVAVATLPDEVAYAASKEQFLCSSPEWTALAKLELAQYDATTAHEMAEYRTESLRSQDEEGTR